MDITDYVAIDEETAGLVSAEHNVVGLSRPELHTAVEIMRDRKSMLLIIHVLVHQMHSNPGTSGDAENWPRVIVIQASIEALLSHNDGKRDSWRG